MPPIDNIVSGMIRFVATHGIRCPSRQVSHGTAGVGGVEIVILIMPLLNLKI
jgi:hypothetical protein